MIYNCKHCYCYQAGICQPSQKDAELCDGYTEEEYEKQFGKDEENEDD